MLRAEHTALGTDAAATWARAVGVSGGMVLVSDDLSLLGPEARCLLDEVLGLGRAADGAAAAGDVAECPDLLDAGEPRVLVSAAGRLEVDLPTGRSHLRRA
jgi:alpha-galactosidase